jgi:hypothetical protein
LKTHVQGSAFKPKTETPPVWKKQTLNKKSPPSLAGKQTKPTCHRRAKKVIFIAISDANIFICLKNTTFAAEIF